MTDENLTPASHEAPAETPVAAETAHAAEAQASESVAIDFDAAAAAPASSDSTESTSEPAPVPEPEPAAAVPVAEAPAPEAAVEPSPAPVPVVEPPAALPIAAVEVAAPAPAFIDEQAAGMEASDHYSRTFTSLNEGDVIQGVVVHIDREGVLVDVGTKSEGIIRRNELSRDTSIPAEDLVQVGQTIDVYVMEAENQDGNLILSKKRADFEKAWEKVQEAKEDNRTIQAMVSDRVKGGLVVDLGIRGFVPASHVGNGSMKNNLERYVGQSIPLKVIEVDKERRKVVLSNKLAQEEERASKKQETVSSLTVGQVRRGTVRRLTNYGAFVDLGGIDGLLHISEMSWTRINHPQEVLKEGQELDVLILKMDLEAGRVSLGLRQILPDPWTNVDQRFHVGDVITGQITRVVPFGIFVQVEGGIEGIIPNSELSARKGSKAAVPGQGEDVEVKIADLRPEERKMTLTLRGTKHEDDSPPPAPEEKKSHSRREKREQQEDYEPRMQERDEPRFTIGDALRAKEEAAAEEDEEEGEVEG